MFTCGWRYILRGFVYCGYWFRRGYDTEENRNKYMGFLGMSIGLGFIFGPAIGGVLGDINLQVPFIASGILTVLLLVYAGIILKEPERVGEANKRQLLPKGGMMFWQYRIRNLFLLSFMVTLFLRGLNQHFSYSRSQKLKLRRYKSGICLW